jgi:hypothetical protein
VRTRISQACFPEKLVALFAHRQKIGLLAQALRFFR